jgi:hypothetical protein
VTGVSKAVELDECDIRRRRNKRKRRRRRNNRQSRLQEEEGGDNPEFSEAPSSCCHRPEEGFLLQ